MKESIMARLSALGLSEHQARQYRVARLAHNRPAAVALERARAFTGKQWASGAPFSKAGAPDNDGARWIETPAACGLRLVGQAHDLASLNHTGWYMGAFADGETDSDSSLACGAVYLLPGRNGRARYVPAVLDPHNNGPALVYLRDMHEGDRLESSWDEDSAKLEAAREADECARIYAEREREYSAAWHAGQQWASMGEDSAALRAEALAILKERKAAARDSLAYPALCATIRARVESILEQLQEAREARRQLWTDCPSRLESAFLDGASLEAAPY